MNAQELDEGTLFKGSVSASPDALMQELPGEESIFLNLRTESYFGLDPIGTRMYRALIEEGTVEAAYERLAGQYAVEPDRLRSDLRSFIERLLDQGLLEFDA